ncbi:MAG: phenylalanine--tRNA ligase subunit beta [Clostridiales bacterium]|nr:phenylalanine--tRNA ligase subunit beta [Clostridiales bacterium]
MFVSMNWIRDYVNLDGIDLKKLINSFTLATAEVEDIYEKGADVKDVVVGEIKTLENHPESNKLHLLTIDIGDRIVNCVCGAPNVQLGQKVAFAKAGGRVVAGEIGKATVAGYESEGMCCSEKELGISDDQSGLMQIEGDYPNGTDIKSIYPIDDLIFEVDNKSLTNRPDLWGHYGIAREFAALTDRELKPLTLASLDYDGNERTKVEIGRPDLVYRYSCIRMSGITRHVSPADIRIRLYYCGMRPINLLADLTNYIMLEIGQPTHAFDAGKIDKIVVTTPESKRMFTTLDKVEREIDENTLMICNGSEPVAIAGIMGGLDSEIVGDTDSVVLESANFDGICVRKTSSRLGHRTDSSARYEKMLDPELTMLAVKRFVYLVKSVDSGAFVSSALTDEYVRKYPEITLTFDKKYIDRYTGIAISDERISKTLTSLGFDVVLADDVFTVKVPSWRATKDVTIKADIIEEITRIYGYDNFEIATTRSPLKPIASSAARSQDNEAKDLLVKKFAMHEVHSYVWCDGRKFKKLGIDVESNVTVLNIESSENGVLRNSMLPTLLCAAYENKDFGESYGIFEIGRIINGTTESGVCDEQKHLGAVLFDKNGDEKALYFKALGMIRCLFEQIKHGKPDFRKITPEHNWQHPKNTAEIIFEGQRVGVICTLHPQNLQKLDKTASAVCFELDMNAFDNAKAYQISFSEPSSHQSTYYDLSLIVPSGIKFSDMESAWGKLEIPELTGIKLIDTFEKLGVKSITVRFFFGARDRSLGMNEIQERVDAILLKLNDIGVRLREQ